MAKFSEIIGGIAKDLIELQVTSDSISLEVLENYKSQEILKHIDVPRYTVGNVKLSLKFAISSCNSDALTDKFNAYLQKELVQSVEKDLVSSIINSYPNLSANDRKLIAKEFDRLSSKADGMTYFSQKVKVVDPKGIADISTQYLNDIYRELTSETQKKLGSLQEFKKVSSLQVAEMLSTKLSDLIKSAKAQSAADLDIDIVIEKDKLEKIADTQLHEISFDLTPDFIKLVQ